MEKQTKPKGKRAETLTWGNCLFVGMEWEKCDANGDSIYNAIFLAYGEVMQKFRLWGYSTDHKELYKMKHLTPCTLKHHWYKNCKWLEAVTIEGAKNEL